MKKRSLLSLFCAFSIISVLGFFVLHGFPSNPTTPSEVKGKIKAQIPLGSDRKLVQSWLDSQHYKYQYRQGQGDLNVDAYVLRSGHKASELSGYLHANARDTRRGWMSYYYIFMDFFFDKNQKLVGYSLREQKVSH